MSEKYLVIVESPAKCSKIQYYLQQIAPDSSILVRACCGHFREIQSIDPTTFEINFQMMRSKSKYIHTLKKIKRNTPSLEIIIATDNDREGEAIGWHLCKIFALSEKTTKRLRFNEISFPALQHAWKEKDRINMNLVKAQSTRQIIDRWIGFTFSPLVSKHVGKKGLSAGRCQTPTLRLIMDNIEKRKRSSDETVHHVKANFGKQCWFQSTRKFETEKETLDCLRKNIPFHHQVKQKTSKPIYHYPPRALTTSKLQQTCASMWKWSPTYTMKRAQELYEKGWITYHRTESSQINGVFQKTAVAWIEKTFGKEYIRSSLSWAPNKAAHEAIRPTKIEFETEDVLYTLIRKTTIQSLMEKATIEETRIELTSPSEDGWWKHFHWFTFYGFYKMNKELPKNEEVPLKFQLKELCAEEKQKDYVSFLNEAQIIQSLESKGIGRPSTYASFVSKIQDRQYVRKDDIVQKFSKECVSYLWKKGEDTIKRKMTLFEEKEAQKLVLEPLGEQVGVFLYRHYNDFFDYSYTKQVEEWLDDIASGNVEACSILQHVQKKLSKSTDVRI